MFNGGVINNQSAGNFDIHTSAPQVFDYVSGAGSTVANAGTMNSVGEYTSGVDLNEVLDRWRHAGAQTWDTAAEGALRIRLGRGPVQPESRRRAQPRQWDEAARSARARAGLSYRPD